MKQRFWNQLKTRLCPRDQWVKDEDHSKCQCCCHQFTFFRRRHHCRFCGKLFCSNCSDLYINGTYLGLSEKYVRHCEFCREEINRIKKNLTWLAYMVEEEDELIKEEDEEDSGSSSEDEDFNNIRVFFDSVIKHDLETFAEELDAEIKELVSRLLRKGVEVGQVSELFIESQLLEVLTKAVMDTKMQILPHDLTTSDNYMDISKMIGIKGVDSEPGQIIELIEGIFLEKDFPIKHMLTTLTSPHLILIENSLDEAGSRIPFEDLIRDPTIINSHIEEHVMQYNPDIVFVEKTVSRSVLDDFTHKGVVVISGLSSTEVKDIVHVSGIRETIKNIWKKSKQSKTNMIGTVNRMQLKHMGLNRQPMIYLERNTGIYRLVIGQRNKEKQSTLIKSIELIMSVMRMLYLERYLLYVDYELWEQHSAPHVPTLTDLSNDYQKVISQFKMLTINLQLVQFSEQPSPDPKIRQKALMAPHQSWLQPCGDAVEKSFTPYSTEDMTIGHFLLEATTLLVRKCATCQTNHRKRFYFGSRGIQVWMEGVEGNEESNIRHERDITSEIMKKYLKKYKEKSDIYTFIECMSCGPEMSKLSKKVKIRKNYLKNSFNYFLYLLTFAEHSLKATLYGNMSCQHSDFCRVIETSDAIFRFKTFSLSTYKLSLVNMSSQESQSVVATLQHNYIHRYSEILINQKSALIGLLLTRVTEYVSSLECYTKENLHDLPKMSWYLEKIHFTKTILNEVSEFLDEQGLKHKESSKNIDNDWTQFLRQMAKVDHAIRAAIEILLKIERKLRKFNLKKRSKETCPEDSDTPGQGVQDAEETPQAENADLDNQEMEQLYFSIITDEVMNNRKDRDIEQQSNVGTNEEDDNSETAVQFQSIANSGQEGQEQSVRGIEDEITSLQNLTFTKMRSEDTELTRDRTVHNVSDHEGRQTIKVKRVAWRRERTRAYSVDLSLDVQQTDNLFKGFREKLKHRRYQIKKGLYIYFSLIDYRKVTSVLVWALNSIDFNEMFQKTPTDMFRFPLVVSRDMPTSWKPKHDLDKLRQQLDESLSELRESYEITAFYHRDFKELREMQGVSQEQYIRSLANCDSWNASGGKSGAPFVKSQDDVLVVKLVKQDEFDEFLKFAKGYVEHIRECRQTRKDSLLAKIYGIYSVTVRGSTERCIVMQNIFFGLDTSSVKVYDLKGSSINRLVTGQGSSTPMTGQDSNFKLDRNFHPYPLSAALYGYLFDLMSEDISFLQRQEVIDYSLLVIESEHTLRMGIIDFMRPYHLKEIIQQKYKEIKYGTEPTVLPPQDYALRFMGAMRKYFMRVEE